MISRADLGVRMARARRILGPRRATDVQRTIAAGARKPFVFVSGPSGGARRYRCDHQVEQLRLAGVQADACYNGEVAPEALSAHYDVVVLYRVPFDEQVERLLASADALGARILGDVDDLIFDSAFAPLLHGVQVLEPAARSRYEAEMDAIGRTLRATAGASASTEPLAQALQKVAPAARDVPNVVSAEMVERAKAVSGRGRGRAGESVTIGYLSGTPTHDRDFAVAADAVLELLAELPDVRLLIAGFLELDRRFDPFGERVERVPYQPWERLTALLTRLDVNLAPLEPDNAFTAAKSCIKYLEAGLVGVPTVASPRPDFQRVIIQGENGFLAEDPGEWKDVLAQLVGSETLREEMGRRAHRAVVERHTTAVRAKETARTFRELAKLALL